MHQLNEFFTPFIGQVVWQVRRGHGSFFTMEFGAPHLAVREPVEASPERSETIRRNLRRRDVIVTGDWHFWVQYGGWRISTGDGVLTSDDPAGTQGDECLRDLDGQKLVSVDIDVSRRSCMFKFDLNADLEIWPSLEIAEDQWSLYSWSGEIVTFSHDGLLISEKADLDKRLFKPLRTTWPTIFQ